MIIGEDNGKKEILRRAKN